QGALLTLAQLPLLLGVGDAVAEDLVAPRAKPGRDVRRLLVDGAVHLGLGRYPQLIEQVEETPDPHAVAVVPPAVHAVALGLVRRRDGCALADSEGERLDVEGDVHGQAMATRPRVVGASGDVRVLVAAVRGEHDARYDSTAGAAMERTPAVRHRRGRANLER